jgi:hypothetical protein
MGFWADEPRALPWAGMNDALGVPTVLIFLIGSTPLVEAIVAREDFLCKRRRPTESWQDRIMRSKGRIIAGRTIKGGAA